MYKKYITAQKMIDWIPLSFGVFMPYKILDKVSKFLQELVQKL